MSIFDNFHFIYFKKVGGSNEIIFDMIFESYTNILLCKIWFQRFIFF